MNRNSNVYTVIYATVLTVLVAVLLSAAALGLKDKQKANSDNEKKQQILSAVSKQIGKDVTFENAAEIWNELKMDENLLCVGKDGMQQEGVNVFELAPKAQFSKGAVKDDAQLPVYVANVNGTSYYIMCMYGAGLWDAIWGYIAVDAEGNIAGCSFDHAGETAGLGAKIKDDPAFAESFIGKNIWTNGELTSVGVTKPGKPSVHGGDKIDGITGATKTCDCVDEMMWQSLLGYKNFLLSVKPQAADACCEKAEGCCGKCEEMAEGECCGKCAEKAEGECCGKCAEKAEGECCEKCEENNK